MVTLRNCKTSSYQEYEVKERQQSGEQSALDESTRIPRTGRAEVSTTVT